MKQKEKATDKRKSHEIKETYTNQNAHDSYGNIYTVKSQWIRGKDHPQKSISNIILNESEYYRWTSEIKDEVLRKKVKNSIAYGKGQLIGVVAI